MADNAFRRDEQRGQRIFYDLAFGFQAMLYRLAVGLSQEWADNEAERSSGIFKESREAGGELGKRATGEVPYHAIEATGRG